MDKKILLSYWDKTGWGIHEDWEIGKEIRTGIPYPDREWEPLVRFCHFEEHEVCDMLNVEFMKQLRENLPELVKTACKLADEHDYWSLKPEDFCGIKFEKDNHDSFFMLEFDGGDNPDEFQSEWMVYIGFDKNLNFTGKFSEETIWR